MSKKEANSSQILHKHMKLGQAEWECNWKWTNERDWVDSCNAIKIVGLLDLGPKSILDTAAMPLLRASKSDVVVLA